MPTPTTMEERFDKRFGCADYDKEKDTWGRSTYRGAGCDDCELSKQIRQEHKDFVKSEIDRITKEAIGREKMLDAVYQSNMDALACMSLEKFIKWANNRKNQTK